MVLSQLGHLTLDCVDDYPEKYHLLKKLALAEASLLITENQVTLLKSNSSSDILYRLNNIWPKMLKNPNARGFFISALLDVNQPRHSLPTTAYQCSRRKVMATIMQISLGENDSRGRRTFLTSYYILKQKMVSSPIRKCILISSWVTGPLVSRLFKIHSTCQNPLCTYSI